VDGRGVDRPPYPTALRLYAIAVERWAEVEAHYFSIDLLGVSPRKFLNLVYAWCVQFMDAEKREEWDVMLEAPLPGAKPTEAQIEREGESFLAAMQMHQQVSGE